MKKFLLIIILFGLCSISFAQNNNIVIGKNFRNNSDIEAIEFALPHDVYSHHVDHENNNLTLFLRKKKKGGRRWDTKGTVVRFTEDMQFRWAMPFNYTEQQASNDASVVYDDPYCRYIDPETGRALWSTESTIVKVLPDQGMILAVDPFKSRYLQCLDMNDGSLVWERKMKTPGILDDLMFVDPSTAFIASSGLYTVNILDGTGWEYKCSTSMVNAVSAIGMGVTTFVAGAIFSSFVSVYYAPYDVTGLCSNTIVEEDAIYFADRRILSCLDHSGTEKWVVDFISNTNSRSEIFINGDIIHMVSFGYGLQGSGVVAVGNNFIAAYDRNTGDEIYFKQDKKDVVVDYFVSEDHITLLYSDKTFARYSLSTGELVHTYTMRRLIPFENMRFSEDAAYEIIGDYFKKLENDSSSIFLFDGSSGIELDNNFSYVRTIDEGAIFKTIYQNEEFSLISNGSKIYLIDQAMNRIAIIESDNPLFVLGSKVFIVNERSILTVEITDLIWD